MMSHPDPNHDPENVKEEDIVAKPADTVVECANCGTQFRGDDREDFKAWHERVVLPHRCASHPSRSAL